LKPDDPEKVKPVVAQEYKWISREAVFETSALVLIVERETRTSMYGDYFVAFNFVSVTTCGNPRASTIPPPPVEA